MPTWHSVMWTAIISAVVTIVIVRTGFGIQGRGTAFSRALTGT